MRTIRILATVLLLTTIATHAQEFFEPSWQALERATPVTQSDLDSPSFERQTLMGLESQSAPIAEAITPEIAALARGLEGDPVRIFNFVHDHIRHVLYFGSKKGAQLTLLERSGNDFDQCALLVALLRAAGYEASYQFGILKMPYESPDEHDLKHWLQLSLSNTNWTATTDFFSYFLGTRGYPVFFSEFGDNNTIGFHRAWVKPLDAVGLIYDTAATAVPFLPAGASAGFKAARAGNTVVNSVQAGYDVARVAEATHQTARGFDAVSTVPWQAAMDGTQIHRQVASQVGDSMHYFDTAYMPGANAASGRRPDMIGSGVWGDITTPRQWGNHLNSYQGFGTGIPILYERGVGVVGTTRLLPGAGLGLSALQAIK